MVLASRNKSKPVLWKQAMEADGVSSTNKVELRYRTHPEKSKHRSWLFKNYFLIILFKDNNK